MTAEFGANFDYGISFYKDEEIVKPTVIVDLQDQTVNEGTYATFTLTVTGSEPLTYTWFKNDVQVKSGSDNFYTFLAYMVDDGAEIYCLVTNPAGSDDSTAHLTVIESPINISSLKYFTRKQPAKSEELKNRIEIQIQPLLPVDVIEEIYKTGEPIELYATESRTITAYYSTQPALTTGTTINLTDETDGELELSNITYYAWGVVFTITNIDVVPGSANVVVEGYPLKITGDETIVVENLDSQEDYGILTYPFPKNHLVQSKDIAEKIGNELLGAYSRQRKDVILTWRGNPALELGDEINVTEYKRDTTIVTGTFRITSNRISYDGTLKETTSARKIYAPT